MPPDPADPLHQKPHLSQYLWGLAEKSLLVVVLSGNFLGFFEGIEVRRQIDLFAVENFFDGEYLQTRIVFVPAGRGVEAFSGGFFDHWLCWRFKRQVNADGGIFAVDDMAA